MGNQQAVGRRSLRSVLLRRATKVCLGWGMVLALAIGPSCGITPEAQESSSGSRQQQSVAIETISSGMVGGERAQFRDEYFELSVAAQPCRITMIDGITMTDLSAAVDGPEVGRYRIEYSEVTDQGASTLNGSLTVEKEGQPILTLDMHVTDTIGEPIGITTLTYAAPIAGAALATAEVLDDKIFGLLDGRRFGPLTLVPVPDPDTIFQDGQPAAIKLSMPGTTALALVCLQRAIGEAAKSCEVAGNTTVVVNCCMGTAPMGCLLCSGEAVVAHPAHIHGCRDRGGCPNAKPDCQP